MLLGTSLHDSKNRFSLSSSVLLSVTSCKLGEWSQITKATLIHFYAPASLIKHLHSPIPYQSPGSSWSMLAGLTTSLEYSLFLPLPGSAYSWLGYVATYLSYWPNGQEGRWGQILRGHLQSCWRETCRRVNRQGKAIAAGSEIWRIWEFKIFRGINPHVSYSRYLGPIFPIRPFTWA